MKDKFYKIENKSADKKYFTIIPNLIANHSSAIVQALYLQMKRLAGDKEDIIYASEKYFCDKLKIGRKALKKAIKYLLEHKWIEYAGIRNMETAGGVQKVKTYLKKDIWKINIEYYSKSKGVVKREPLEQGLFKSEQRGVQKDSKGVLSGATKKNNVRRTKKGKKTEDDLIKENDRKTRALINQ